MGSSRSAQRSERAKIKPVADYRSVQTLETALAQLNDLDTNGLRLRWRKLFRSPSPSHLPRYLLFRIIAYRLQAKVYGDLDRETVRFLDQVGLAWQGRNADGEPRRPKAVPPVPPVPNYRSLKPGTLLAREHAGTMQRVVVVPDGFLWNDTVYRSLSEVARAITGTKWNGHRFFGLPDRTVSQASSGGADGSTT